MMSKDIGSSDLGSAFQGPRTTTAGILLMIAAGVFLLAYGAQGLGHSHAGSSITRLAMVLAGAAFLSGAAFATWRRWRTRR